MIIIMVVNVEVQFSFPPTYPDVPPEMEIVSTSGPLKPEHPQEIEQFLLEQVRCCKTVMKKGQLCKDSLM